MSGIYSYEQRKPAELEQVAERRFRANEKGWGFFELFFFSSRRRHTRLVSDWSSDVCSSDPQIGELLPREPRNVLQPGRVGEDELRVGAREEADDGQPGGLRLGRHDREMLAHERSEERRVGKECRSRWRAAR